MNSNLFVGGFPYETTQEGLSALFGTCGTVISVKILLERETGRSRGLGFVEMSTETEARAAIAKLNGSALGSRKIFVSEARPQERRPGGFVGRPGFVERRSGKDRRQARGASGGGDMRRGERPTADESRREGSFERKKKWAGKPGFPGKKESKKKWGPGGPGDGNKWGGKPRKFGGGFGGRGGR